MAPNAAVVTKGKGTATKTWNPFFGDTVNRELAKSAIKAFSGATVNIWGNPDDGYTATATATSTVTRIQYSSLLALRASAMATAMAGSRVRRDSEDYTYYAVADLGLPNINSARNASAQDILAAYNYVFTPQEYDMYQNDPLCYFANVEDLYWYYWDSLLADSTSDEQRDAMITTAPFLPRRQDDGSASLAHQSSMWSMYSQLYTSLLPEQFENVHLFEPEVDGGAMVVVAETSCPGLWNRAGVVTSYRELSVSTTANAGPVATTPPVEAQSTAGSVPCQNTAILGLYISLVVGVSSLTMCSIL